MNTDILIIGAGACGLMAGRELARQGKKVAIIEARPYYGGRIHTVNRTGFTAPVETGAEFIHGKQEYSMKLLKEFGINYHKLKGELWQVTNGVFNREQDFIEDYHKELEHALKKQVEDISVKEFLDAHFAGEKYNDLKHSIRQYIEGYDAAELSEASVLALKEDWLNGDDKQYRIEGGYNSLTEALAEACKKEGCRLYLSTVITKIEWKQHSVSAIAENRKRYNACKAIITIPPSLLARPGQGKGLISFQPEIPAKRSAAKQLGYGGVIKFMLEFTDAFWKENPAAMTEGKSPGDLGFLFSDATIPTWWTQFPDEVARLTGWLAGPRTAGYLTATESELLNSALASLAYIFNMPLSSLQNRLKAYHIVNWLADPFSRGAYSFDVVNGKVLKEELTGPLEDTLYFAGEALSRTELAGTVEAALASGMEVSEMILKKDKVPS
jgi:monoamine oxidase